MDREQMTDQDLIDSFLMDQGFQKLVYADIGNLYGPVQVDWGKGEIRFYGQRGSKILLVKDTLDILRRKVH